MESEKFHAKFPRPIDPRPVRLSAIARASFPGYLPGCRMRIRNGGRAKSKRSVTDAPATPRHAAPRRAVLSAVVSADFLFSTAERGPFIASQLYKIGPRAERRRGIVTPDPAFKRIYFIGLWNTCVSP